MSHETLQAISICIETGIPVFLEGIPGGGKTASIRSIAQALGRPMVTVIASLREPTDFNGWPVVHDGAMHFVPPVWAKQCLEKPNMIIFFDEISTTPPAVQAALLRIIHERVAGEAELPQTVSIVAAYNDPEHAPGGWEISSPLANRVVHLSWKPRLSDWVQGMVAGWQTPNVALLPADWREHTPLARSLVSSFANTRQELWHAMPQQDQGKGWPSPRTWEMASTLLAACMSLGYGYDNLVTFNLIAGVVGNGAGGEFLNYLQNLDLPNPEDLIANPEKAAIPTRHDQFFATLGAVVSAIVNKNTPERWYAGWKILKRASESHMDIATIYANTLATNKPKDPYKHPEEVRVFAPVLAELKRYRQAS